MDLGNSDLKVALHGPTLLVTLARPQARNAISAEITRGIAGALNHAEANDAIRAVVLTGEGDSAFCAGADLKAIVQGRGHELFDKARGFAGITMGKFSKPLIAAVNGFALGGGCEVALACDLVVASEKASFGLPEVKRGLIAGGGGVVHLARRIPRAVALEMVLTGEPLSAQRAYELGLVNQVVAPEKLLESALGLAAKIAANGPLAVRISKDIVVDSPFLSLDEAWRRSAEGMAQVTASEDMKEGVRAFTEKRPPVWTGR